ncbi:MAG: esterase-like activity of phytase family protein [Verrucomicrobia bacterium]|nr:esterase-like activity of phytase family protein [Verrucomicrobiota bacterium]
MQHGTTGRIMVALAGLWLVTGARADLHPLTITDPEQGVYDYVAYAAELSGLTRYTGDVYFAVSDAVNQRRVYQLEIRVHPTNGYITHAAVLATNTVAAGYDLEGIAYHPERGTLFIADEGRHPAGGFIREHRLADGAWVGNVALPPRMLENRDNFGLESLSWSGEALWTANEEALENESALATATTGSLVRLQKFDRAFRAAGQWAYRTDPYDYDSPLTTLERSGVSDLLALPDGRLLVLERALGVGLIPTFRNRLYWVDFTGATDVSAIPNLDAGGFQPVGKRLLWERNMGIIPSRNFEGLALGSALPQLGPTSHSVLLIADNGGGTNQHLYALILHGLEIARTPLEHWRQQHWGTILNEDAAANAADPDGDRWPNLFEYAFGRNPRQAGPTPPVTPLGSAEQAGLSYVLTNSATDVIVWMEQNPVGPHTDAWTTAGIHETRVTNGNQIHVTAWVTNPPPATAGDLFLRLRAHVP